MTNSFHTLHNVVAVVVVVVVTATLIRHGDAFSTPPTVLLLPTAQHAHNHDRSLLLFNQESSSSSSSTYLNLKSSGWNNDNNNWKADDSDNDTTDTTDNNNNWKSSIDDNWETIPTNDERTTNNGIIKVDDDINIDINDDDEAEMMLDTLAVLQAEESIYNNAGEAQRVDDEAEMMLDTLAVLQAEESVYNNAGEAQRVDTIRRMEEWGFDSSRIIATASSSSLALLDDIVATDTMVEQKKEEEEKEVGMEDMMQFYREDSYLEDINQATVESHTQVPKDEVTNEPIRSQMVYVNEHACIGCTNCAMVAQSTFFMEEENGKARVFEQWGDDETTVQIAMDTCPVNCIHYIPYEELVQLEINRRNQFINVVGGLVSRGERGGGGGGGGIFAPRSFGAKSFTDAPTVSRGYDKSNPDFVVKETVRLVTARRKKLELERRQENRIADL